MKQGSQNMLEKIPTKRTSGKTPTSYSEPKVKKNQPVFNIPFFFFWQNFKTKPTDTINSSLKKNVDKIVE